MDFVWDHGLFVRLLAGGVRGLVYLAGFLQKHGADKHRARVNGSGATSTNLFFSCYDVVGICFWYLRDLLDLGSLKSIVHLNIEVHLGGVESHSQPNLPWS